MMLVTSLPPERASAEQVVALYRMRWQIELAFKSLGKFDALRAETAKLARSWLLAHLIAAILVETSQGEDLALSPSGQSDTSHTKPKPLEKLASGAPQIIVRFVSIAAARDQPGQQNKG